METVKVVCVGPGLSVRGGIAQLTQKIQTALPDHIDFSVVPTLSNYTGAGHPDRGSRVVQTAVFVRSLLHLMVISCRFHRPVFHVHLAQRGSTLRKGMVCVALRLLGLRYVVHAHAAEDALFHDWVPIPVRRGLAWGFRGAQYFITLTRNWREYYANHLNLSANRLLVLPTPAALPPSVPSRRITTDTNFLFLGRVGERKGTFELIQAVAALPDEVRRHCHLTVAGDGDLQRARDLVEQLDCSSQVSILGWVGRAQVDQLLEQADVLVLPSHAEGMSSAVLEAMAWGLAVVTSAAGGADEFLTSEQNCILIQAGNVHDIAEALRRLATDTELRRRLGAEARRTATRFSLEEYVSKLTCLYEELARESPGSKRIQAVFTA